jgi:hypothetical protein
MSDLRPRGASRRQRRFAPLVLLVGLISSGALALSLTGAASGFVATINNTVNTAGTGSLGIEETDASGSVTCATTSTAHSVTCATINKFGGSTTMVPGISVPTTVRIKNTGTVDPSTFTLTPGATCSQSANGSVNGGATDLCAKMNITITQDSTTVFTGTLASLAGASPLSLSTSSVSAGSTSTFVFTVTLSSTADDSYQGYLASLPLTWTLNS